MSTSYRVAVATSDGKMIDTHFGHAQDFTIFEVGADGNFSELERRSASFSCGGETCGGDAMKNAADSLKDCEFVLAAKIGPHALRALAADGITGLDVVLDIPSAIRKIHIYKSRHPSGENG